MKLEISNHKFGHNKSLLFNNIKVKRINSEENICKNL